MLAGYQTNQFHHLETIRLGGSAASVEFTNLARYADYQHLQLRVTGRTSLGTAGNSGIRIRLNSDTGNNYAWHRLEGNGSSIPTSAQTSTNGAFITHFPRNSAASGIFGVGVIDILDPFEAKNKTFRSLNGVPWTYNVVSLQSALWMNTNSVTTINIYDSDGGDLLTGSRFSLYGIKARA
jgi:hypothetical protein